MEHSKKESLTNPLDQIPAEELLRLDNQVCFALYVCSKEIIRKYKPLLEPLGLTYTGYLVFMALWETDSMNVKELGKRLYLDSGTLTPLLKKLEASGLVERKRLHADERNVVISLTDEGRGLRDQASIIPKELVCSINQTGKEGILVDGVENGDILAVLHKLMDNLTM